MSIPGATSAPLRSAYDVVIVGAGIQGVALSYELARRGAGRICVLDASYPGSGGTGRNGEMIRSAFSSTEWTGLFDHSLRKWQGLSAELDFNVLYSRAGYVVLASTEEQYAGCVADAAFHRAFGLRTEALDAAGVAELVPAASPALIRGGLVQHDAGFAHHDATLWGYAQAAARHGVELHPYTRVTGIDTASGRVTAVRTDRGTVATPIVVNAAGAFAREVAGMAGVDLPTRRCRLEIMVTESLQPFLRPAVAALELLGYCHQTSRGEFVGGTEFSADNPADDVGVSLEGLRDMATKFVRLFPQLAGVRVVRHWSGLVDQTPDLAPVIGRVPELDGLILSCGWMYGFMGAPGTAELLAEEIVDGRTAPVLAPFSLTRLREGRLIAEGALVVPREDHVEVEAS